MCTYNQSTKEVETGEFLGLANYPPSSRFIERLCLETPGGELLRKALDVDCCPLCPRIHMHIHMHTELTESHLLSF